MVDVYDKHMAGKFDKIDTETYIAKIRNGMNPFGVRLRKIKVTTVIKKKSNTPTGNLSIKEL
jgi:hypothetical protein